MESICSIEKEKAKTTINENHINLSMLFIRSKPLLKEKGK